MSGHCHPCVRNSGKTAADALLLATVTVRFIVSTVAAAIVLAAAASPGLAQDPSCGYWTTVPTPVPEAGFLGSSQFQDVVAIAADDVWAVGEVRMGLPEVNTVTLAMHWDGMEWTIVPTPNPSHSINSLEAVAAVSSDDVWAVGLKEIFTPFRELRPLILRWDGTSWEEVVDPVLDVPGTPLWTIEIAGPDDIWFGADGTTTFHWDGSNFEVRSVPPFDTGNCSGTSGCGHGVVDIAAVAPNDVWAVGGAHDGDYSLVSQIWHWDGVAWTHVPGPSIPYWQRLYGVVALASDDVWAVGDLNAADPNDSGLLIVHWDGSGWTRVPTPLFEYPRGSLFDVTALAPDDIWVAGIYTETPPPAAGLPLTMHYDGTDWTQVMPDGAGPDGAWLRGVTSAGSCDLWAVGSTYLPDALGDMPHVQHFVFGTPPDIDVTPLAFDLTTTPGGQVTSPLFIENVGDPLIGGTLTWSLSDGSPPPNLGWVDSDAPGGPTFAWKDITGTGTAVSLTDDGFVSVPLPFPFSFYGDTKTSMLICANGYLTFGNNGNVHANTALPHTALPNDLIAVFWDDLNPELGGTIHYDHDVAANEFIVQYTNVQRFGGGLPYTFQVILRAGGEIVCQYLEMQGNLNFATIGIENADGSVGVEVVSNAPYVHDELAVRFGGLGEYDWLTENPSSGSVPPQSSTSVDIIADAAGLDPGTYTGEIIVSSNDPDESRIVIPVTFTVSETAAIAEQAQAPPGFYLHGNRPNPFNPFTTISYELPSAQSVRLVVYDTGGRAVRVLVDDVWHDAGEFTATWDGRDAEGSSVASGVYFYRIVAGEFIRTRRAVLVR